MPNDAVPHLTFEPVAPEHLPMLDRWLKQPHWRQWWDEPEIELGHIRRMVDGQDTTRPYIFSVDGEPVGYIQYWFVGDHQNESWIAQAPWLAELPPDAIGVDLSIGDAGKLSRGIGPAALRDFAERLVGQGHRTVVVDPDLDNRRAIRAYEKAGFCAIAGLLGRTGNTLLMQYVVNESGSNR